LAILSTNIKLYEYKTVANSNQNNSLITNEVKIIILFLKQRLIFTKRDEL
jgi:hypothetical protein